MIIDLEKYFEKIYVVNLDRRQDRYNGFINEINKYGLKNIERFPAVDGKMINTYDNPLLPGEIGILKTHLNIITKCIENNVKNVLILEDDVYFTNEILKLDEYMSLVPNDWDFIYFGGNHAGKIPPNLINDKILKLNFTLALQCVAINNAMFDIIETILSKMNKQVDTLYAELHDRFNAYGFYPNMAKQKPDFSDIQNKNVDYSIFFNN